jgi:hypothetical protein
MTSSKHKPNSVTPQHFPEIRWHGHWIWVPEEPIILASPFGGGSGERPESHGLFRKTFTLNQIPAIVPARMTADSRYLLYVNGQEVFRGPIRSQPRRLHYDFFNLTPYLQPGQNAIAVYVKYFGAAKSSWMPAVANSTLGRSGVLVFEANLGDYWLVSDGSWLAHKSDAWSDGAQDAKVHHVAGGVPAEEFDARKMPEDWRMPDFDDSSWGQAQVITPCHIGGRGRSQPPTDPYGPLFPRPIAKQAGERVRVAGITIESVPMLPDLTSNNPAERAVTSALTQPAAASQPAGELPVTMTVPANGHTRLVLDMGRIVGGFVEFSVSAPAGTTFDFGYFEEPVKVRSMFGAHGGNRYIARGYDDKHTIFDPKGFRYVYILIHGVSGSVTLNDFAVQEYLYPWQSGATFECSDEALNRIYKAGIRTVQLNSWDAFMDCPTREQRAWVGDAVVHQMVHLVTNTDWRLAWHYLALSNSPRSDGILPMSVAGDIEAGGGVTIPDWSLHWVHGVYNLYLFSGDRARVKEYMPTIERVLRWYLPYLTQSGVLQDVVEWNLIDWSSLYSEEQSAIVTASWARGLREFAEMGAWLGEHASQEWAEGIYAKVKTGFEIFWDEGRGAYVDYVKDGVQQRPINQLAGALAIVSRLAPQERWQRIIETITDASRLVVRSWAHPATTEVTPEAMSKRLTKMTMGGYEPDWDVENEIVISEPFMSYVVHDAVVLAGMADRLPDLYKRWLEFLVAGYDTIGENWGHGTHVHGWSCTPTKDLIFYTLGVTPAEPGYTVARIAPRLGKLAWAKGSVPTPHGLIHVEVTGTAVTIASPVAVVVDLPDQTPLHLAAGNHVIQKE